MPEIISRGMYPPTPLPEIGITEKETEKENLYAFDIETLKRTGSDSFYSARFVFKGTETPEVAVSTLTKDVAIRKYSNWREILIGLAIGLLIFVLGLLPFLIIGDWSTFRARKKQLIRLSETLENSERLALTSEQRDLIVDMCNKEFEIREGYFYRKMLSILNREHSKKTNTSNSRNGS